MILQDELTTWENLCLAYQNAARGKRSQVNSNRPAPYGSSAGAGPRCTVVFSGKQVKRMTCYNKAAFWKGSGNQDTECSNMTLQDLEPRLAGLSRAEKAELVQKLVREIVNAWPGIEKIPGVVGGEACIVGTRIPVWSLENYRRLGWSEAEILENFPSLRAADLVNAWAYADAHQDEINLAIRLNEEA